jgi:hypothetical protein
MAELTAMLVLVMINDDDSPIMSKTQFGDAPMMNSNSNLE